MSPLPVLWRSMRSNRPVQSSTPSALCWRNNFWLIRTRNAQRFIVFPTDSCKCGFVGHIDVLDTMTKGRPLAGIVINVYTSFLSPCVQKGLSPLWYHPLFLRVKSLFQLCEKALFSSGGACSFRGRRACCCKDKQDFDTQIHNNYYNYYNYNNNILLKISNRLK